ncbi:glycoside hydrolase family 26 protein [Streptomyces sp. NBC_01142]|uniref:glycoside hydrolase family 26 protein n=1 Tax=Streptomyces sp. NBC_01142 TaxID=2975865 RepID=UPI00224E216E|nr:glycosyl hydrolase [Streptomyces sp. NBC_01142]MCX4823581.1 glycoside hydrolase family 26 protein [Streptomyces sp. NBC_01142]
MSTAAVTVLLAGVLALQKSSGSDPSAHSAECRPTELLVPKCGAWFGAYVRHSKPDLEEKVLAYEKRIGRTLDIVYAYHDMSVDDGLEGTLLTEQEQRVGKERMLLLSWESKWWNGTPAQQPSWKQIASGALDETVIDVQAERIKKYGKPLFLSFDLEMDTRTPDNGTPAEYVAAYRHIHERFRELGVTNVVWAWVITGYTGHSELFRKLYPGDAYVDWIGYNQYNYYRCHKAKWQSFEQTQTASHDWIRKNLSDDKPLMLSEFGTADDPSKPKAQAEWYEEVPRVVKELDGVRAALQWNYRDPGPGCDLALARDESWKSLRKVAADPYFNQPRPRGT